ncbi:hypothetical protein ACHWQZ_G010985 [Mnemiopsis leidyi]
MWYVVRSVVLLVSLILPVHSNSSIIKCGTEDIDAPIGFQDGNYLIAGIFDVGRIKERQEISYDGSIDIVEYCDRDGTSVYNIQKALIFREVVERYAKKFDALGVNVGHVIYDSCKSFEVLTRISVLISTNDKIIGVSGPDRKDLMTRSAGITASVGIPTFIYMFNDATMMDESLYQTLFSMIETEETEAKIMINFLKQMSYTYVDIWYHKFSEEMASYIYETYVRKEGCGRFAEVTSPLDIPKIGSTFEITGGEPSSVQLILSNSQSTTEKILKHMVSELGFKDKIYIFGISNGRRSFLDNYVSILQPSNNFSVVLSLPPLLNTEMGSLKTRLTSNWTSSKDDMDVIYKNIQLKKCPVVNSNGIRVMSCKWTSWLPYVIGGTDVILQSLHRTLSNGDNVRTCPQKLRRAVFNSIIDEDRLHIVSINGDVKLQFSFRNKSVNLDYELGIFRSQTSTYEKVGSIHIDHIYISNSEVLDQTQYQTSCSAKCRPGEFRLYDDRIAHLPCCWECRQCDNHSITVGFNENTCRRCRMEETSNDNHTACTTTTLHYITPTTNLFLGVVPLIGLGGVAIILISIVVFKNEERPIIKASDPGYLYMILFGLFLGMAASFMPMLKPSTWTCSLEYMLFLISSTIITTNLLWKCIKIYGIFASANSFRAPMCACMYKRAGQTWLNLGTSSAVLVMAAADLCTGDGVSWRAHESQIFDHSERYLICQGTTDKSIALIVLPLTIPTLYFIGTLVMAFKMRMFPHNFKETLNIFGATLIVMLCCIMFLSGYNLSHLYLRALLRSVVIYVACIAFLVCLFLPRIVLLVKKGPGIEAEKEEIKAAVRRYSSKKSFNGNSMNKAKDHKATSSAILYKEVQGSNPFCSSLSPWEQRLLIPNFLLNIYNSIQSHGTEAENAELVGKVLWCLVNLLQDEDDGVRRRAAGVILEIIQHPHRDIAPELVLPILLPHLISLSPLHTLTLLEWVAQSEMQDLMTSHYFSQYKSEGYAGTTRDQITASPDSAHPLFEPDLVNSFAEPLCVPFAVHDCIQNLEDIVKNKKPDFSVNRLKQLSTSTCEDFEQKLGSISGEDGVKEYVLRTKFEIFAASIKKVAQFFDISLDEKWNYP